MLNPGPHGFSEILYAFSSAANNNGSAFGGLTANTPFYNTTLGIAMFFGRFWVKVPVLALAGVARAEEARPGDGGHAAHAHATLRRHARRAIVVVGALTFIPALALGPIVEQLLAKT